MTDRSEAHELDNDDTGGFSNPAAIGDLKYEELEARVFNALDNDYRTLLRIKEHAGLERSFDLAPVIEGMELDRKIRRYENGTITAFFRPHHKPKRFWTNGDGTVGVEWDEKFVHRDDEAKAKELTGYGDPLREKDEKVKAQPAKIRSKDLETSQRPPQSSGNSRDRIKFTREEVEKAASLQYSQKDVGKALGASQIVISRRLKTDPEFKAAFDRGRKAFLMNNPEFLPYKKSKGPRSMLVEAVAKRRKAAGAETEAKPAPRPRATPVKAKRTARKTAAKKGTGSKKAAEEPVPVTTNGDRPGPISERPAREPVAPKPVHSRYITLPDGSQFLVAFEGNIFMAGPRAMVFLRRINELLDEFGGMDTRELDEGVKWTGVVR